MKVFKILWKTFVHVTVKPTNTEMRHPLHFLFHFSSYDIASSQKLLLRGWSNLQPPVALKTEAAGYSQTRVYNLQM
jgi:hypothetical protein